jgi:diguanylate cyclase (GGDEF)-like protein
LCHLIDTTPGSKLDTIATRHCDHERHPISDSGLNSMPATATSASASGHAMPVNDDMLEAFMRFPAPLAMLDLDGHVELANSRFMEHFGPDRLDTAGLVSQVPKGLATWQPINLAPQDLHRAGLRARAIRTSGRILLMIDDSAAPQLRSELDELHGRIDTLERLAATDHLTGAWNRAHLDRVIESELARSQANRQALSLILFDIDHFKKINDRFGHAVGDSVLRELVQVVNRNIRPSDMLFRWGGEEFVVLVSAAGYRRADIVAEKLRTAVAEHRFGTAGTVTISLGVAEHAGGEDAATWFRRMDAALYGGAQSRGGLAARRFRHLGRRQRGLGAAPDLAGGL